jgi:hypothetical protein
VGLTIKGGNYITERRTRRETDRLCSDNEAGEREGKTEGENLKN